MLAKTAFLLVPTGIIGYMLYKLVKDELRWDEFAEIILLCVRWYCRYGISYRDLEAQVMSFLT